MLEELTNVSEEPTVSIFTSTLKMEAAGSSGTLVNISSSTYLLTYLLSYLLTHSMVQDIIWKSDCHSARQKISCFLILPEGSLPCSHKPATEHYSEPAESRSPHRSLSPQGPS
jgi:hypothetical protein